MNYYYPDKAYHFFDKLISRSACIYKIETPVPEKIYTRLDNYHNYTGKAFYSWKKEQGLYRTEYPHIYAPRTDTFVNALHHISLSIHFGIYLFSNFGDALQTPRAIDLITNLVMKSKEQKRLVIFAGRDLDIPKEVESLILPILIKTEQVPLLKRA